MKKRKRLPERSDVETYTFGSRVGEIVVSTAGHDAGLLLVIVAEASDGTVLVADGKTRRLSAPKHKKMRHLTKISKLDEEKTADLQKGLLQDAHLRKILSALDLESLT